MSCLPNFYCDAGKVEEPLCLRHDKDKQVRLKEGFCYEEGTLVTSGKDEDPTVWTPWELGDEICGVVKCTEDLTKMTCPCPVQVLTHGCVNANRVWWPRANPELPEAEQMAEQEAINQAIKEIIANEKCCLQFDRMHPGCP